MPATSGAPESVEDWLVVGEDAAARAPDRAECPRETEVLEPVSDGAWDPVVEEPGAEEPAVFDAEVSAQAIAGPVKRAAPTPKAAAKAPMRPTYADALIVSISLRGLGAGL